MNQPGPVLEPHQCSQCDRSYKRPEHLQRHLKSHDNARPYVCELCRADFQRSDVLRRHQQTCVGKRQKLSHAVRRSCEQCATSKRACDLERPCGSCVKRRAACSLASNGAGVGARDESTALPFQFDFGLYEDTTLFDALFESMPGHDGLFSVTPVPAFNASADASTEPALRFLEGFTRNTGLIGSFDCGTEAQRAQVHAFYKARYPSLVFHGSTDSLTAKSNEIIDALRETVTMKARNSSIEYEWSSRTEQACQSFFAPDKLRLYHALYWAIWHPNVNFVHCTFDSGTAKAALVASVAIIGAAVSPDDQDVEAARSWFNTAEELVFADADFCADDDVQADLPTLAEVQALQAAYIVCLFQNWEGSNASRRRIRRSRYSAIVARVRDLGLANARHPDYRLALDFSWHDFAVREQFIRVSLWIFLLDTAFVIFHNFPPRIAIKELKMHFAHNEACFQAESALECYQHILAQACPTGLVLADVVGRLCHSSNDVPLQLSLADLGPLNLFVLTSSLHSIIFQLRQSFGQELHLTPVRNALLNWMEAFRIYSTTFRQAPHHDTPVGQEPIPQTMWQRVGFSRFCPEYWLLAKLMTDKMAAVARPATASLSPVLADGSIDNDEAENILPHYDETSMQQVNRLIADFQKVVI